MKLNKYDFYFFMFCLMFVLLTIIGGMFCYSLYIGTYIEISGIILVIFFLCFIFLKILKKQALGLKEAK